MATATQPATTPLAVPGGMSLPEKVVQHVAATSTALEKAAAFEATYHEKQAAVDALIPKVCEVMLEHERITPQQGEKLATLLKDPLQVLELLIKVAGHRNANEIARLGSGTDPDAPGQVKTAAANGQGHFDPASSLTDPNVGARTTRVKQSSVNLFRGLGLNPPSE